MSIRFRIIIPMFNVEQLIGKNIAQLRDQTHADFRCVLVDDMSTDGTVGSVQAAIADDSRFELVVNHEKKYALRNAAEAIAAACDHDDDVIVPVDGDDQLAGPDVLARIAEVYEAEECWLTYGSYVNEFGQRGAECSAYPERVVTQGSFRRCRWHASHLKTFKYGLWRHVRPDALRTTAAELSRARIGALMRGRMRAWWHWRRFGTHDLLDPSGVCFRRCYDKAMMLPMLELAGARQTFIPGVLYRYRSCSDVGSRAERSAVAKWGTRCIQEILRRKPKLEARESLSL
jgi:glycosyltransferase involved in cell wall biosynthesis